MHGHINLGMVGEVEVDRAELKLKLKGIDKQLGVLCVGQRRVFPLLEPGPTHGKWGKRIKKVDDSWHTLIKHTVRTGYITVINR